MEFVCICLHTRVYYNSGVNYYILIHNIFEKVTGKAFICIWQRKIDTSGVKIRIGQAHRHCARNYNQVHGAELADQTINLILDSTMYYSSTNILLFNSDYN